MTHVINLYGGPGTGKSTTAAGVFFQLKTAGLRAELVTEYAKDLTWDRRHKTLDDQLYVFAKQWNRMYRCSDQVDVIVTDSPLLLSLIYTPKGYPLRMSQLVLEARAQFTNHDFFLNRTKPFQQYGRTQSESEARELDHAVLDMLHVAGVRPWFCPADVKAPNYVVPTFLAESGLV